MLVASLVAILGLAVLLWPTGEIRAQSAAYIEAQRSVYELLLQVRDMQQQIIASGQYGLQPQVNALLLNAIQLHEAVKAGSWPDDEVPSPDEPLAPADDEVEIEAFACESGDTVYEPGDSLQTITVSGSQITAQNGRFVCEEDGWRAHLCTDEYTGSGQYCQLQMSSSTTFGSCPLIGDLRVPNGLIVQLDGVETSVFGYDADLLQCSNGQVFPLTS